MAPKIIPFLFLISLIGEGFIFSSPAQTERQEIISLELDYYSLKDKKDKEMSIKKKEKKKIE